MSESYSAFCECPGDYQSEFVRERIVKAAAKEHKCAECGGAIKKGESYQYASGKCEGDLWQVKTCARCLDLIEYGDGSGDGYGHEQRDDEDAS